MYMYVHEQVLTRFLASIYVCSMRDASTVSTIITPCLPPAAAAVVSWLECDICASVYVHASMHVCVCVHIICVSNALSALPIR